MKTQEIYQLSNSPEALKPASQLLARGERIEGLRQARLGVEHGVLAALIKWLKGPAQYEQERRLELIKEEAATVGNLILARQHAESRPIFFNLDVDSWIYQELATRAGKTVPVAHYRYDVEGGRVYRSHNDGGHHVDITGSDDEQRLVAAAAVYERLVAAKLYSEN